jgi:pentatricopeptide repeat protein
MFNSLLDGCAKQHRLDDALKLVAEMEASNVHPSNFTLSILVKLLGRSRRLNEAFQMTESIPAKYGFQANIHVYTCLIQACIHNRQLHRAFQVHDMMINQSFVQPDSKAYSVLARGCSSAGQMEKLASVVRAAYGLPGAQGLVSPKAAPGMEPRVLEEVMQSLSTNPVAERLAVPLLVDLKSIGVHVERGVYSNAVKSSVSRFQKPQRNNRSDSYNRRNNY